MSTVNSTTSGSNTLRITGMASGLDVDSMVKKMMSAEQIKIDKAQQAKQIVQWKQEAYQDIIKDIKDLQNTFFDSTSSDKNILASANYAGFSVTGGDSSIANITAGVGAQTGSYKVVVGSLASKASSVSTNITNNTSSGYTDTNWNGKKLGFIIDGGTTQTIDITTGADVAATVSNINTQINLNNTLKGKVQAVVSAGKIQFQALSESSVKIDNNDATAPVTNDLNGLNGRVINPSVSTTLAGLGLSDATDSFQITYNGTTKTISVKNTDKLSDIINNISTTTSGALTASFSQLTGRFMIQSTSTGSSQSISIATGDGTGKALSALGVTVGAGTPGSDATATITPPGGSATTITKSTNNFTVDGMTYNLTGEGNSTVTVGADNNKVYDKIKSFIDKYNTIIDKIQTKLTEKKNYSYTPLTDAQKEDMEDTQITAWETKAKTGILKNDSNLQTMLNNLRSAFTTAVSGTGFTMGRYGSSSIGLDTSQDNDKPGHIDIVDASKLKAAIATNGEQIFKMFANVSTSTNTTTAYNENGIFARIKNILQDNVGYTNATLNTAILTKYANKQDDFSMTGSSGTGTLPNQIYQKQLIIDKLKETFNDKQEAYYQKFASLETAMNNLNSQQSWLTQQFSS